MKNKDFTMVAAIILLFLALAYSLPTSAAEVTADLVNAIATVESGGDSKAIGDGGKALGMFQLHKVYVQDVNRILKRKAYTYEDRMNPKKSREMTIVYLKYYGWVYESKTGKPATLEVLARIHNGGPNGWAKPATEKYWLKVKKALGQ